MCTNGLENVPQDWDDDRDPAFFRITATLFSPNFTYGASVLLASNDRELVPVRVFSGGVA